MTRRLAALSMLFLQLGCSLAGIADGKPRDGGGGAASTSSAGGVGGSASPSDFAWIHGHGSDEDQGTINGESSSLFGLHAQGGIVLAASTRSTINFGGGPLGAPGASNAVVASLSPEGQHRFSAALDGTAIVKDVTSLAVAPDGRIAVAGSFRAGTLRQESPKINCTSSIRPDGYVIVFDPTLRLLGARQLKEAPGASAAAQEVSGVAFDGNGDLYVVGRFVAGLTIVDEAGSADTGCSVPNGANTTEDAFVLKLDATLSCEWSQTFGTDTADESATAVAAAPDGDVVVGGVYREGLPLPDGTALGTVGGADGFVARLGPRREFRWAKSIAASGADSISALALDDASVYVAAPFNGSRLVVTGCDGALQSNGQDIIVAKLSGSSGDCLWRQQVGGARTQRVHAIALSDRSLAIAGSFDGAFSLGERRIATALGSHDAFLLWLGRDGGDFLSQLVRSSTSTETFESVAIEGSAVFVAGTYAEPFDGLPPVNRAEDFFVGRLREPAP